MDDCRPPRIWSDGSARRPAQPLVFAGRPASYRTRRLFAWAAAFLGLGNACVFGFYVWLLAYRVGQSTFATLVIGGIVLAICATLSWSGIRHLQEIHRLDRLRLAIGPAGIRRLNRPPWHLPWQQIRHIAVTEGEHGKRRLLVDDGTGTPASRADLPLGPGAHAEGLFAARHFVVDLPIDALDTDATQVVAAIRRFSGGRLPDLLAPHEW